MISQCLSSGTSQLITLDVMLQDDAKLALFCFILLDFALFCFFLVLFCFVSASDGASRKKLRGKLQILLLISVIETENSSVKISP